MRKRVAWILMTRCPHSKWPPACALCHPIQISKDQLWNFTWRNTGPKGGGPVEIHSKSQFLRECRQRGLKWLSKDEMLKRGEPMRPTTDKHDVKAIIQTHYRDIRDSAKRKAQQEGVLA